MGFVHLHVHSQFSLLDGTLKPGQIAELAAKNGMTSVAMTDTVNLFGAVAFYKACKKAGVRPILGAEMHIQPEGVRYEDPRGEVGGFQVVLLVENETGYANLCQLITKAIFYGVQYKPRVDFEQLKAHCEGLILLTGGRKGVFRRLLDPRHGVRSEEWFDSLQGLFGPQNMYIELQDHGFSGQGELNQRLRKLSEESGYQTVVTNAVHYEQAEDAAIHEVLNAISQSASLCHPERIISDTDQAWFKTEEEMRQVFPDDEDAISRTVEIANRCEYHYTFDQYHFPATTPPDAGKEGEKTPDTESNWQYFYAAFPPPVDFGMPNPEESIPSRVEGAGNLEGYFAWYSREGLKLRLEAVDESLHKEYWDRLQVEIDIICSMGFPAYMLIVAEFINWSKDNGIPVGPGRGSAAGSLVAFSMRITDIDPILYGLLFERFLNPERVSMPDIDVDFCQDRREEAIEHVRTKYGNELVSQIITYGTLKAKAALRDVARVLKLNFGESDRLSKMVPDTLGITLSEALEQSAPLASLRDGDPKIRRVIEIALKVEGMCRQTGVHAAGVVIADRPLVEYAPLYRDEPEGGPVVQYDMKSAESIGLIKFDFLGLKTLDQIRDALLLIEANHNIKIDMTSLPVADPKTYKMLGNGDGLGVFQLESSGMRDLLSRLRPNCMDDMVALVALYRPGPLQSGMTDDFVERKHGRTQVEYPLPVLEPILKETYGTIVYQEQVMRIAQVMASYSLGEADLLRRAMGKKKKEEMDKQRVRFVEGSEENGYPGEKAQEIFDLMATFAAYGFNKSHSAAYGYISFQTAYLKAHYRAEYMAALMTVESGNTDKVLTYIQDCRSAGIRILPACVNESGVGFTVPSKGPGIASDTVRYGLAAIKNVGTGAVEAILEAREGCGGTFPSLLTLFEKVDYRRVNRRVFEHLIKAGALDFSGIPRPSLLAGLAGVISAGTKFQADASSGQASLFGASPGGASMRFRFPEAPFQSTFESLQAEKAVLGLYLTGHPMDGFQPDVKRFGRVSIGQLSSLEHGQEARVVGIPGVIQNIRTRRGDRMAFVHLEDSNASVEVVFFSKAWTASQKIMEKGEPVLLSGVVENNGEELKIKAKSAELLTEVRGRLTRQTRIVLQESDLLPEKVKHLKVLLEENSGSCPMKIYIDMKDGSQVVLNAPKHGVDPGSGIRAETVGLFGRQGIVEYL